MAGKFCRTAMCVADAFCCGKKILHLGRAQLIALKGPCCAQHVLFYDSCQSALGADTAALVLPELPGALEQLHKLILSFC